MFVAVDADEIERRYSARRRRTRFPEQIASLMAEHGFLDDLRLQAESGDWIFAESLARALLDQDRTREALDVAMPFAATGWWRAVTFAAATLDRSGQTAEAIRLVEPVALADPATLVGRPQFVRRLAVVQLAGLFCRQDRVDEAFALLSTDLTDCMFTEALVRLSEGRGRDEAIAAALQARIELDPQAADPEIVGTLATVLERQGLADEAVELLTHAIASERTSVNHTEHLAGLLARLGRLDQLRAFLAQLPMDVEAQIAAEQMAESGRVDDAVDILRPFAAEGSPDAALVAATILDRHGRTDEAIEILGPIPRSWNLDWLVRAMSTFLVKQGRLDEAFAAIPGDPQDFEHVAERLWILAQSGRVEQAITEMKAREDCGTAHGRIRLATLLADAGRLDEAIETLWPFPEEAAAHLVDVAMNRLAKILVRRGRVKDAIAVCNCGADAVLTGE